MLERRARSPPPEPLPPSAPSAPPAAEEMRAGGVKVREERTRLRGASPLPSQGGAAAARGWASTAIRTYYYYA